MFGRLITLAWLARLVIIATQTFRKHSVLIPRLARSTQKLIANEELRHRGTRWFLAGTSRLDALPLQPFATEMSLKLSKCLSEP